MLATRDLRAKDAARPCFHVWLWADNTKGGEAEERREGRTTLKS